MNFKFAILSTIAIIASSVSIQAAEAREGMSARFDYAPNVWRNESVRMPKGYGEPQAATNPHSVNHGSMPSGRSMLGLDPTMLAARPKPRVAPIAQQNVNSTLGFGIPVPFMNPVKPVENRGQFGQPLSVPPVVASLPPQASKAQPKSLAPTSANSNVSGRISPRRSANTAVAGRVQPRPRGLAAKPAAPLSYGNNFGYQSGSTAPVSSSASTHVHGDVYGRVLYKSTKH